MSIRFDFAATYVVENQPNNFALFIYADYFTYNVITNVERSDLAISMQQMSSFDFSVRLRARLANAR